MSSTQSSHTATERTVLYDLLCTFLTSVLQDAIKTVSFRAIFIAVLMPSGAGFILEVLHFV